jgi:hypothetical protein
MMKKVFLFLCLSVITSSAFAQYATPHGNQFGILTISSNNNQNFWLFVDDILQNEYSTNIIRLQGLQLTYYKIRVEIDNSSYNCVGKTVLISNIPNNNNYVITKERENCYSFKKTQANYKPYFIQNIILPNYNYFSAYDQYLYPGFNPNTNYGQGNQFKGNIYRKYLYPSQGYNQGLGNPQGHGTQPGHGNYPGYGNYPPPGQGNPPPPQPSPTHNTACMHPTDFSRALSTIQQESFENSKLNVAKQMTSNNRLCVSQIMQICGLFSFENTKLDYAKYAYLFCVDKNNYYQVNEIFSFSSSKDELRKYVGY